MTLAKMLQLMLGTVGLRFGGAAIGLLMQLALTRVLAPEEVGVVFLTMSVAAIASLLVTGGYPNLAFIQLPRLQALHLERAQAAFHGAFLKDFLLWNVVLILAVLVVAWLSLVGASFETALLFGAASAGVSGLLRYSSAVANGLKQFAMAFVPDSLVRPGLFFLVVFGAALIGARLSLQAVLLAFVGSNILVVIGQAVAMGRDGLQLSSWTQTRPSFTKVLRWRAGFMMVTAGVVTMFADIVTLLGGLMLASAEVAILGICIRLSGLAGYVLQASQQFVLPDLTVAFTHSDAAAARSLLMRLNVMMLAASIGLLLGTFVLGKFFLGLFGANYLLGYWLLVICMGGQVIRALSGMNQNLLAIRGHQSRAAGSALTALLIFICAAVLLATSYGLIGIGFAVLIGELAWGLMLAAQAQSLTGQRADLLWLFIQPK
jgi:O-antigen/teichoic acid export membrane protein